VELSGLAMLLFRCLTYSSKETTTTNETATATKAKEDNNEVTLLPVELESVGIAVGTEDGFGVVEMETEP